MKKYILPRMLSLGLIIAGPAVALETRWHTQVADSYAPFPSQILSVHQALYRWMDAVRRHDVNQVTGLYSPDAILLPTLWPDVLKDEKGRERYFKMFLANQGIRGKVEENHLTPLGKEYALNTGVYNFTFEQNGRVQTVPARYSFLYQHTPEGWKIIHHHSSRLPEVPVQATQDSK